MTAPPAAPPGHRWEHLTTPEGLQDSGPYSGILGDLGCDGTPLSTHRCQLDAGHTDRCRCRCGALTDTTRET